MNICSNTASHFLNNLLTIPAYTLTQRDQHILTNEGLDEYIFHKVTSSEFRRSKIDEELAADIRTKIRGHIDQQSPISFSVPFGGYKVWNAWSYPGPEWAEVFSINYMLRYAAPLVAAYPCGVAIHYSYGDSVMDVVSNMPIADVDKYVTQVKQLLALFQARQHRNISIDCVKINDFYSGSEHSAEFHAHYKDNVANWTRKYSDVDRMAKIASARRNLMRKGVEDLTLLTNEQWEERVLASAMWCDAHDSMKLRRRFNKYSQHIQLGNIRGRRLELHVGSCDTSVHQFWVGVGIIEQHSTRLLQRIVSQDKLEALKAETNEQDEIGITRVSVNCDFMAISNNYGNVYVFKDRAAT